MTTKKGIVYKIRHSNEYSKILTHILAKIVSPGINQKAISHSLVDKIFRNVRFILGLFNSRALGTQCCQ